MFAGWGYFTAACCKLIATGIFWVDGRHLWLWLGEKSTDVLSQTGMFQYNFLQQAILNNYWLATIILIFGITTELLGPILWFQKTRAWMGLLLVGLHIGILHSMNISFDKYIYIIILVAFPWDRWLNKWFFTKS